VGLEPVMLTVVMMRVPPSCQGIAGSDESQTHECLRWDGAGGSGSVDGDPSERREPPSTWCRQISALTIPSRGSGWPASRRSRVFPRITAPQ
jgi:hypothetical protein